MFTQAPFAFSVPLAKPASLQSRVQNTQQNLKTDIDQYMFLPHTTASPLLHSTSMTMPGAFSSGTMMDNRTNRVSNSYTSDKDQYFTATSIPTNEFSSEEDRPPILAPACLITNYDIVLIALTEPFLMAWCQDVNHVLLAMESLKSAGLPSE